MSKAGRKQFGFYKDEQAVIEVIKLKRRLRKGASRPLGPWEIARELNAEGYKSQVGRSWSGIAVKRILEREAARDERRETRDAKRKKQQLESKDYLMPQEVVLCRQTARESDRLIFEVLLGSGIRAGELCDLDIRDLGIYHGQSQIDVRFGKGSRNRTVKIGPGLRMMLEAELSCQTSQTGQTGQTNRTGRSALFADPEGKRIKYRTLYDRMVSLGKRAGLHKRLHPHVLRHTFASGLYHYQKDLEYVRKQLGHASIATTQIYVNVFSESELEQMAGFEQLFGGKIPSQILQVNCDEVSQDIEKNEVTT